MTEMTLISDMSSDEVFDAIERIAADSSKTGKEAKVREGMNFPTFRQVCAFAYNPTITFGIDKMPAFTPDGDNAEFDEETWVLVGKLARRELTGNAAKLALVEELAGLSQKSATLLQRILKKDLRAGFTDGTLNRVEKGFVPEFPYMRCSLLKKVKVHTWPWEKGVISQEKADGMFVNVDHEASGVVRLSSRQGTEIPLDELQDLTQAIKAVFTPGFQMHGELLVVGPDGVILPREEGNGILNSIAQGGKLPADHKVRLYVWDQIPLEKAQPKGKYTLAYRERLRALLVQLNEQEPTFSLVRLVPTRIVKSMDEALTHYRELLAKGKEGTILKHPDAIWKDGTSTEQVKLKLEVEVDLEAIAFVPGTGKNAATFGSIRFASKDRLLIVDVSGFTDKRRAELHALGEAVLGKVGTVKANSIMTPSEEGKPYSLFLPRIVEFPRTDKTEADTLERVKEQFDAAVKA